MLLLNGRAPCSQKGRQQDVLPNVTSCQQISLLDIWDLSGHCFDMLGVQKIAHFWGLKDREWYRNWGNNNDEMVCRHYAVLYKRFTGIVDQCSYNLIRLARKLLWLQLWMVSKRRTHHQWKFLLAMHFSTCWICLQLCECVLLQNGWLKKSIFQKRWTS